MTIAAPYRTPEEAKLHTERTDLLHLRKRARKPFINSNPNAPIWGALRMPSRPFSAMGANLPIDEYILRYR